MKAKWKVLIGVIVLLLIAGGVVASVRYNRRGMVTVQSSKVVREDLTSIVTSSGEIKPRNYINIGAEFCRPVDRDFGQGGRSRREGPVAGSHR